MHATDYVSATGGVTEGAADHRQAFIGTDARARFPVYDLRQGPVMTKKKKLEIRFLVGTTISYIRRGPYTNRSPAMQCAGRLSQCTRRHVPQDQPWPPRQRRILCVGWAPPDLRYVTKKEVQLKGGGTVELTVLDSSSPKLTDPPEGRLCKL